jgi:hypothetical protein
MATVHEEDTKPWTKLTQTRVRTPVQDPRRAWSQHGFQGTTLPTFHFEWVTTWFKNLGQPSYVGLLVPYTSMWIVCSKRDQGWTYHRSLYLSLEVRIEPELRLCSAHNNHHTCHAFPWFIRVNLWIEPELRFLFCLSFQCRFLLDTLVWSKLVEKVTKMFLGQGG